MERTCGTCGFLSAFGICPYFQTKFDPSTPGCPQWKSQFEQCSICGNPIIEEPILYQELDGTLHQICGNCAKQMGKCSTCIKAQDCLFRTDPSPIPAMVMQKMQQGNTIIQQTVPNPERIAITCEKCECYHKEEKYCLKQTVGNCFEGGWKGNYHD